MTIYRARQMYFLNCRDCGQALGREEERRVGLCLRCLGVRAYLLKVRRMPVLVVKSPLPKIREN